MASTIKQFLTDLAVHQAANDASLDAAVEAVNGPSGLVADFAALKQTIADLQASQGEVTPEDGALIDTAEAKATAFGTKLSAFSAALKALDEATPPPAPPAA